MALQRKPFHEPARTPFKELSRERLPRKNQHMPGTLGQGNLSIVPFARTLAPVAVALDQPTVLRIVKDPGLLIVGDEIAAGPVGYYRSGEHQVVIARFFEHDRVAQLHDGLGSEEGRVGECDGGRKGNDAEARGSWRGAGAGSQYTCGCGGEVSGTARMHGVFRIAGY